MNKKFWFAGTLAVLGLFLFTQFSLATPPNPTLTFPLSGMSVVGKVDVQGTAAGSDFSYYKVEYKMPGSTQWVWVDGQKHTTPVTDGTLATWDTTGLPNGVYALRVLAADKAGQYNTQEVTVNLGGEPGEAGTVKADPNTIVAMPASGPVNINQLANDAVWGSVPAATVKLSGGENFPNGESMASIKAAYYGDMIYFLVQWDDPTQSFRRSPFQKQEDGTWKKLSDPNDKGGDNNIYYEDKAALIWDINDIEGFDTQGCFTTCHVGEEGKPYGNKYAPNEGDLGDIWHMKLVRTGPVGQTDDQYLDATRYDKAKFPEAGRKSDPRTGGGYTDIVLKNGKPEFMSKSGTAANEGGTYWVLSQDKVGFNDTRFQVGDEAASIVIAPFTGDRGNLKSNAAWQDGKWTLAIARNLNTGSKYDVQFNNLDKPYYFGLAAFENAQVRHAYNNGALKLVFAQAGDEVEQVAAPVGSEGGATAGGPPNIPANHATAGCTACHAQGLAGAPKFPDNHATIPETQCASCHKSN